MIKVIGILKFLVSLFLILGVVIALFSSHQKEKDLSIILAISLLFFAFASFYSFYLIKTGIWNLKEINYSKNIFAIIGLIIHFISIVSLLIFSLSISSSKQTSIQLFLTTLPFTIIGFVIGIYDGKQFYKNWKKNHNV